MTTSFNQLRRFSVQISHKTNGTGYLPEIQTGDYTIFRHLSRFLVPYPKLVFTQIHLMDRLATIQKEGASLARELLRLKLKREPIRKRDHFFCGLKCNR